MYYLKLIRSFFRVSLQDEMAHRSNFWISLLNATLNLVTGVLGVAVLFGQVESINGWDFASTLTILGVYLTVGALRGLFIDPSLNSLAGMDGEVWTGKLDFTLLRPLDVQFQASFRQWRPFRLLDLILGLSVIVAASLRLGQSLTLSDLLAFVITLVIGMLILYALSGGHLPPMGAANPDLDHPRGCDHHCPRTSIRGIFTTRRIRGCAAHRGGVADRGYRCVPHRAPSLRQRFELGIA